MKPTLLKLTLLTAAGVAMLIGLGTWQMQRLAWKRGLIARVEQRVHGDPVPLSKAWRRWSQDGDVEYLRVRAEGSFDHDRERHLYTVVKGQPGWRVITPLRTVDGYILMVDRGFVPDKFKDAATRPAGQIGGDVTLTGLARAPGRPNAFTPESDPARNRWYWRDLDGMAASVLTAPERERLVPFFVEADDTPNTGGWPKGGVTRISFPNRHLEYALTWYGLAVALVAVYAVIVMRWRRQGGFT
jgi:surfeit locus 1 family protein